MDLTFWKAFRFFDVFQIRLEAKEQAFFAKQSNIASVTTGSENLFVGTNDGHVHIFSSAFQIIKTFLAHDEASISHMRQIPGTPYLVTIAERPDGPPTLKVWALDTVDKKTNNPQCLISIVVGTNSNPFPIAAFAVTDNLSKIAVGFTNGTVTLIRGDFIHERGTKRMTVFESEESITGLQFQDPQGAHLYISTVGRIALLILAGKGIGKLAQTVNEVGCGVGCMTVDPTTGVVVVAQEDSITYYFRPRSSKSYTIRGAKKAISRFGYYLVVISPSPNSGITIIHPDLKFIAHQDNFQTEIKTVFSEWGDLFVMTSDGNIYRYHERSINQRLDALFQRNLYVLALELAHLMNLDSDMKNVIYRKYGDYWYQKQDYDTAMQQYLRAITCTEPSQVIRKFLDAQRIHNLVDYLEKLHQHHLATSEHTTLLLNCYAKLKDVQKLEEFLKSPNDLKFDLATAISVCRQGGYYDQAAFLARKFDEHDTVIEILVADSKRYAEAVAYIYRLNPDIAYRNMIKFAPVLLDHAPEETTQFLIDFYTGVYKPKKDSVVVREKTPAVDDTSAPNIAISAVQSLASIIPLPYMSLGSGGHDLGAAKESTSVEVVETVSADPPLNYDIPRPRTAFSAFLNHPSYFTRFLEACAKGAKIEGKDREDVYTTLLEMYLHQSRNRPDEKTEWEAKAKTLIDDPNIVIQKSNILLLSELENFQEGTTLVREQEGLRFDIFRSYTAAKDTAGAIRTLRKYGSIEPQLYPLALKYFTSSPEILAEARDEVGEVLKQIDSAGLMAPLQVVQILAASQGSLSGSGEDKKNAATLNLIKPYLLTVMSRQQAAISQSQNEIEKIRTETARNRAEIEELSTGSVNLYTNHCSGCNRALELPVVHFLCKHSFHQRCLNYGVPTANPDDQAAGLVVQEQLARDLGLGLTILDDPEAGDEPSSPSPSEQYHDESGRQEHRRKKSDLLNAGARPVSAAAAAAHALTVNPAYQGPQCPLCETGNEAIRKQLKIRHKLATEGGDLYFSELRNSNEPVGTVAKWFGKGVV